MVLRFLGRNSPGTKLVHGGNERLKRLILVVPFIGGLPLGQANHVYSYKGKGSEDLTTSGSGGGGSIGGPGLEVER
jgi:hypothetical protein